MRQIGSAKAWLDRAHLGVDLAEDGVVGGDGQIAQCSDYVAATDGVAGP